LTIGITLRDVHHTLYKFTHVHPHLLPSLANQWQSTCRNKSPMICYIHIDLIGLDQGFWISRENISQYLTIMQVLIMQRMNRCGSRGYVFRWSHYRRTTRNLWNLTFLLPFRMTRLSSGHQSLLSIVEMSTTLNTGVSKRWLKTHIVVFIWLFLNNCWALPLRLNRIQIWTLKKSFFLFFDI